MSVSDLISVNAVLVYVLYAYFVGIYGQYYQKIITNQRVLINHLGLNISLAFIGLSLYALSSYSFEVLYLMMPLQYLLLLLLANYMMQKKYNRPVIMANKYNMASEETKQAVFWDYAWFMIIHFIPAITPIAINN